MFEKSYQVERFLSNNGKLSPRYLGFLLSDIMELNANSYGAGVAYHTKHNLAWVLTDYEFEINGLPGVDEEILVGTLPYSFKRYFGYRLYQIRDTSNTIYLKGKGKFVLINTVTKLLTQPSKALLDMFTDAHKDALSLSISKYKPFKNKFLYEIKTRVHQAYIDSNNHMNNAYYLALSHDFLKSGLIENDQLKFIKVYYRKEALLDMELTFAFYDEQEGIYVEIKSDLGLHGYVLFQLKNTS